MEQVFLGFNDNEIFTWVILPLLIFLSRIADQSIGTLRLIFLSKGYKFIAPFLGFFEVIIWLVAVSQIMKHLDNVLCYIAYGAGFAMGNFIGIILEEKISIGNVIIRLITGTHYEELVQQLSEHNYGLTLVDAQGSKGPVKIIFSIIKRKDIPHIVSLINMYSPHIFYTIEEVKDIKKGIFRSVSRKSIFKSYGINLKKTK
ncbi:MAG: DUF2179 domain-containing protein [Lentimicrobiaceae bacterium]|jgi:uncharacterized protein YebE (UPF0316 family)|nr:DUF2179 domain-containing protein [Lentimicrobiaceae bacterium]